MNKKYLLVFVLIISSFSLYAQTYITNVTIADVEKHKLIPNQTIVITDNVIYPDADEAWAYGAGRGGRRIYWNHRLGIVLAGDKIEEVLRQQAGISKPIGWDLSVGFIYRPLFIENVVLRFTGAMLLPGTGFKDIYPDRDSYYSVLANLVLTY